MRAVVVLGIGLVVGVGTANAEVGSVAAQCPAYRAHLQQARTSLLRGERTAAIAALRGAQEALAACLRDEGGETALAYAGARPFPACL
jgi:hypothetical protein